ncbi:MAG TPA: hypothetical protein PKK33_00385 [Candidatus Cloacimonadota bacterium]|nr:hypothetical protein [Candidatus Cloacimonadota bacterium]
MMHKRIVVYSLLLILLLIFMGCENKVTDKTGQVKFNISGLKNLRPSAIYEAWLIVDGNPVSVGKFSVTDSDEPFIITIQADKSIIEQATGCYITIEPIPDPSSSPSGLVILAGDFVTEADSTHINNATLTISHPSALNNNFVVATGKYVLSTPTDTNTLDETSGVWFEDISSGYYQVGLHIPSLPAHWKYEAWAVLDDTHILSMGKFSVSNQSDDSSLYCGTDYPQPYCPGEDFLNETLIENLGITWPVLLNGKNIFITVQPDVNYITTPFFLTILKSAIPANAAPHLTYSMSNQSSENSPHGYVYR